MPSPLSESTSKPTPALHPPRGSTCSWTGVGSAVVKFARPRIIVTCVGLAVLGNATSGRLSVGLIWAAVLIVAWTVHANSINDYADREIDAVNLASARDRPLVTNDVGIPAFWAIHAAAGVASLLLAVHFGWRGVGISAAIVAVDYAYSLEPLRFTRRPVAGPTVLALAYVYAPFTIGFWCGNAAAAYPWRLTLALVAAFGARLLLKDFRDVAGDLAFGKKTFLLRYGAEATCKTSGVLWGLAVCLIVATYGFNPVLIAVFAGNLAIVLTCLRRLAKANVSGDRRGDARALDQERMIGVIAAIANFTILGLVAVELTSGG